VGAGVKVLEPTAKVEVKVGVGVMVRAVVEV